MAATTLLAKQQCRHVAPPKYCTRGDRFIPTRLDEESMDVRQFLMYAAPSSSSVKTSAISDDDNSKHTTPQQHVQHNHSALSNSTYTHDMAHGMFGSVDASLMAHYGGTNSGALSSSHLTVGNNDSSSSSKSPATFSSTAAASRMLTFSRPNLFAQSSLNTLQPNTYDRTMQRAFSRTSNEHLHASRITTPSASSSPANMFDTLPSTILDAPGLVDDFYMDVLDWSARNLIAIALQNQIFFYNPIERAIVHSFEAPVTGNGNVTTNVASLKFSPSGERLAISTYDGNVHLWDVAQSRLLHTYAAPTMEHFVSADAMRLRSACLAWRPGSNDSILSVGGNDRWIRHYDTLRSPSSDDASSSPDMKWYTHDMENVAGLVYAPNGDSLAAGTSDGSVLLWTNLSSSSSSSTNSTSSPTCTMIKDAHKNKATVRALAFCPWRPSILATGGGSADKSVRIWNVSSLTSATTSFATPSEVVRCVKTLPQTGQVTNVLWSQPSATATTTRSGHLLVTHGFYAKTLASSYRAFGAWRQSGCVEYDDAQRALFSAISPDGSMLAIGDSNQHLEFWQLHA